MRDRLQHRLHAMSNGWSEIDVYPSLAVLQSSLTVLIVGGYLFIVGVLAQLVKRFGGAEIFQFQRVFQALTTLTIRANPCYSSLMSNWLRG